MIFLSVLHLVFTFFIPYALAAENTASDEDAFLDKIQRQTFQYFLSERDPETNAVKERAHNFKRGLVNAPASLAAMGMALTAFPVAVTRNWIDQGTARQFTEKLLQFMLERGANEKGFFYHYLDPASGKRASRSEVSPIDTSFFIAGALFAAEYYEDVRIRDLAMKLYERIDWSWMMQGEKTLALAWSPEEGFFKGRWDHYDESMLMYLLAIGSPTHPIPADAWQAIARPVGSYQEYRVIQMPPLFTHQYSHIWIDFRNKNDGHADYFKNSINATLANRAFAMDEAVRYKTYGANSWGLSASDGPFGYRAYGAPPGWAVHDGTVSPSACGSSMPFTPQLSLNCLRYLEESLGERLWGNYGFSSAYNLDKDWFSEQVIGIDQGALLLMIENYRSGFVWQVMARNRMLQQAMQSVGFKSGTMDLKWAEPPQTNARFFWGGVTADGLLKDWPRTEVIRLEPSSHKENGSFDSAEDASAQIMFGWNEDALFFFVKVTDEDVVLKKSGKNIWQDDLIELYIDVEGDGLIWKDARDYQIGFRPAVQGGEAQVWSWFQDATEGVSRNQAYAYGYTDPKGYVLEGFVKWKFLGIRPRGGVAVRLSVALHDVDRNRSEGKLQWFFRNERNFQRFELGKILLETSDREDPAGGDDGKITQS